MRRQASGARVAPFAIALVIAIVHALTAISSAAGGAAPRSSWRPAAEMLAGEQVVVLGRLVRVDERSRRTAGGCRPPLSSILVTYTIAVDKVLQGYESHRQIELGSSAPLRLPNLAPGVRVVAWAYRAPDDNWQYVGNLSLLTESGHLRVFDFQLGHLRDVEEPWGAVSSDLESRADQHPVHALRNMRHITLCRVLAVKREPELRYQYTLRPLKDIRGNGPRVDVSLTIVAPEECIPDLAEGDSLLLPSGLIDTPPVRGVCIDNLAVRCGFVPGLGLTLSELGGAVRRDSRGMFELDNVVRGGQGQ
jgi:hypothetical protein